MNLEQFKTNVIEAMEAASIVVDAQFREANTVSEIISLMSALWLKELPGNLSVQMRDWTLDTFSERTLADYGILVNPTEVMDDQKVEPWLVLLDGSERKLLQSCESQVAYRGGELTDIQVVRGSADLCGQRSADCFAESYVVAKRVAKVLAHDYAKVEANGCPLVVGSDDAKLVLRDSYGEANDECRVVVQPGGRLLSRQTNGKVKVDWGGMALLTKNDKIAFGDGVILRQYGIFGEAYTELIPRMKRLAPLSGVHYHPEFTLEQLKAFYLTGTHEILYNGYELINNESLVPLIERASSKMELANLLLPYTQFLVKGEPADRLVERFAPELLSAFNVLTTQTTRLPLNGAFPVHVFGNMALSVASLEKPAYCHDASIGVALCKATLCLTDQASGVVANHAKLNAEDQSFGLLLGGSVGSFKGESSFVAKGESMAVAYDQSRGIACDQAVAHGLGHSKLQLKDQSTGHLSYNSRALVWNPEVRFIADGFSWAYVKGGLYGRSQECRDHAVMTRVTNESDWENMVKSFEVGSVRKQANGRKM